jgi:uncharacterized glyoxalase superfamily protein PhnB
MLAHLAYDDVGAAADWLIRTFAAEELFRYGGEPPQGVQMRIGKAVVMLGGARPGRSISPKAAGGWTQTLSIFIDDVEGLHARLESGGVFIAEELNETAYGELQFVAVDPEGHRRLFARHVRDIRPSEWGAVTPTR